MIKIKIAVNNKQNYQKSTLIKEILYTKKEEIFKMNNYSTFTISPFVSKDESTDKKIAPSQTEGQITEKVSLSIFELPVEKIKEVEEEKAKKKK